MSEHLEKQRVSTDRAPAAIGPYSQAAVAGNFVFVAGQLGVDPVSGEFTSDDVAGQTRQAIANLEAVLAAANSALAGLVQVTVYLADMADFPAMNAVYQELIPEPWPARVCIEAAALPKQARVEIAAVAVTVR